MKLSYSGKVLWFSAFQSEELCNRPNYADSWYVRNLDETEQS